MDEILKANFPKLWLTDFDGTIKPLGEPVAEEDQTALKAIGANGGIRVVDTGRSIRTFEYDWHPGIEIDYLISSAGLAISRFGKNGHEGMLESHSFQEKDAAQAVECAIGLRLGFVFCFPPPRTHAFYYKYPESFDAPSSFRAMVGQEDREPHPWKGERGFPLGQIILIAEPGLMRERAATFKAAMPWLSYAFTSSPYHDGTLWLEVYPPGVSKGDAAKRLAALLGLGPGDAVALGNDYNDLALLDWAGRSYLSSEGPKELQGKYGTTPPAGKGPLRHVLSELCPGCYESYLSGS
ncbi:MAG: HAD family hydrolase [Deltaproteobacteria bacterium]|jgi:hydroxymethylpyrimidine pyrophosphatase-like HAD family hydrolase|nr:HAD family hydrolase [Deltaproteobacteria bacterium]